MADKRFENEKKVDKKYYAARSCVESVFAGKYSEAQEELHKIQLKESDFYTLTFLREPDVYAGFILACAKKNKNNPYYDEVVKADLHFDRFLYTDYDEILLIRYALFKENEYRKLNNPDDNNSVIGFPKELKKELKKITKKYNELSENEKKILKYKAYLFGIAYDDNSNKNTQPVDFGKALDKVKGNATVGNPLANKLLAEMYVKGIGTKPDLKKAIEYQKIAAENIGWGSKFKSINYKNKTAKNRRAFEQALEYINLAKLQSEGGKPEDIEENIKKFMDSYKKAEEKLCTLVNNSVCEEYIFPLAALYVQLYCNCISLNDFGKAREYFDNFFALCMALDKKQMQLYLECFAEITDLFKIRAKILYILSRIQEKKKSNTPPANVPESSSDENSSKTKITSVGKATFEINHNSSNRTEDFNFEIDTAGHRDNDKILENPLFDDDEFIGSLYCQASMFCSAEKYYEKLNNSKYDIARANCLYVLGEKDKANKIYEKIRKTLDEEQKKKKANKKVQPSDDNSKDDFVCNPNEFPKFLKDGKFILSNTVYSKKCCKKKDMLNKLNKQYSQKGEGGNTKIKAIEEMLSALKRRTTITVLSVIAVILCAVAAIIPFLTDKF